MLFISGTTVSAQDLRTLNRMDIFDLEWVAQPQISPDGLYVVFEKRGFDVMSDRRTSELVLFDMLTGKRRRLTHLNIKETRPVWSPDSRFVAFIAQTYSGNEIFVHDLKRRKTLQITDLPSSPGELVWHPDGKSLVFNMMQERKPVRGCRTVLPMMRDGGWAPFWTEPFVNENKPKMTTW